VRSLSYIFEQNARWAEAKYLSDREYFSRMETTQTPQILWIGCSDSRVCANAVCDVEPGEVFVHRNVGNIVHAADLNCMSVLQYAVDQLKVRHIVVCGHHGCGAVAAALKGHQPGLINHWLEPIRELVRENEDWLASLPSQEARCDSLCEMNVRAQVENLLHSPIVREAWRRNQPLVLHGWIYGLSNGRLRDLHCTYWGSPV
jgi:carbonic anhydrase